MIFIWTALIVVLVSALIRSEVRRYKAGKLAGQLMIDRDRAFRLRQRGGM
jgi:hypothetical protein